MELEENSIPETSTARDLATMFGLSERHVRRLSEDGIIPRPVKGRWPTEATVQRYIASLLGRLPNRVTNDVDARLDRIEAAIERLAGVK